MKVVFAFPVFNYSGAPKMMSWIANQMAKRGHEVKIVSYFSNECAAKLDPGVEFHFLGLRRSGNRFIRNTIGMAKAVYRLDKYMKEQNPDVFVSFLDSVGMVYLPIAKKRCLTIGSERADPYSYKKDTLKARISLMKKVDKMVFQTEGARDYFKDIPEIYSKSVVIPNPVVLKDYVQNLRKNIPKFSDRENKIVTVGRLSLIQKRQDVLINAFELVHKKHPELQLVMYGDGQDKEKIKDIVDNKRLTDCITLAGKISDVEKTIFNARVFVLSSDLEGIPNALIEAMSVGIPCVSTDCSPGGARLLINDGENGYIVPKGDIDLLADRICDLLKNEDVSNRFSEKSILISERFSEEKIAEKWENAFLDLISNKME